MTANPQPEEINPRAEQVARLVSLVRAGGGDALEAAWMTAIEDEAIAFTDLRPVLDEVASRNDQKTMESLLWLLLSIWSENRSPDDALEAAYQAADLLPDTGALRDEIAGLYRAVHAEFPGIDTLAEMTLGKSDVPAAKAVAAMEKFLWLPPGTYVSDSRRKSPGRIMGVDAGRKVLAVSFGESDRAYDATSVDALEVLPADEFRAIAIFDKPRLETLAREDPARLVRMVLQAYGPRMGLKDLKLRLADVAVPSGGWSKWWATAKTAVKRDPHVEMSEGTQPDFFLRSAPVTYEEEVRDRFDSAAGAEEKLLVVLGYLNEAGHNPAAEAEALTAFAADMVRMIGPSSRAGAGERLAALAVLAEIRGHLKETAGTGNGEQGTGKNIKTGTGNRERGTGKSTTAGTAVSSVPVPGSLFPVPAVSSVPVPGSLFPVPAVSSVPVPCSPFPVPDVSSAASADLANLVVSIRSSNLANCTLAFLKQNLSDRWPDVFAAAMPGASAEVCERIAADLASAGHMALLTAAANEIMRRPEQCLAALAWLWKTANKKREQGTGNREQGTGNREQENCTWFLICSRSLFPVPCSPSVPVPCSRCFLSLNRASMTVRLMQAANDLALTDVPDKARKQELLNLVRRTIAAKDLALFRTVLENTDAAWAKEIRTAVSRNAALSDHLRVQVLEVLGHVHPVPIAKTVPPWEEEAIYTTQAALAARQKEFEDLVNIKLPQNSTAIGEAAARGDLSENAEFTAALEERDRMTERANAMQADLVKAKPIPRIMAAGETVNIGTTVRARRLSTGQEETLTFLGPWDADTRKCIYYYKAPLPQAFMGKRVGETVVLRTDLAGEERWEVLEIKPAI